MLTKNTQTLHFEGVFCSSLTIFWRLEAQAEWEEWWLVPNTGYNNLLCFWLSCGSGKRTAGKENDEKLKKRNIWYNERRPSVQSFCKPIYRTLRIDLLRGWKNWTFHNFLGMQRINHFSHLTGVRLGRSWALSRAVAGLAAQGALGARGWPVGRHRRHRLDGHRAEPLVVRVAARQPVDDHWLAKGKR